MKAREMFKELGLDYVSIDYDNKDIIKKISYYDNNRTEINMRKDQIRYYKDDVTQSYLESKYLRAIMQQYEELGWYE